VGEAFAGKITGMVIDETAVRQQMLLSDPQYFNKIVFDAYKLLGGNQYQPQQQMY
jgi:hypothetical protein